MKIAGNAVPLRVYEDMRLDDSPDETSRYAGVTDFYCGKLPQEILAFGTGISRKNRRFCHKSYPKQQNGKLEIPCKQTNQRLWVSTLLTYVDFNSNSHMSISWFSF